MFQKNLFYINYQRLLQEIFIWAFSFCVDLQSEFTKTSQSHACGWKLYKRAVLRNCPLALTTLPLLAESYSNFCYNDETSYSTEVSYLNESYHIH